MRFSKRFRLRASRQPENNPAVSGVVYVIDKEGKGYSYIRFDESFVESLGKVMSRGVSPGYPCFIKAMQMPSGLWRVFCLYIGENEGAKIYESMERPAWLGKVNRP